MYANCKSANNPSEYIIVSAFFTPDYLGCRHPRGPAQVPTTDVLAVVPHTPMLYALTRGHGPRGRPICIPGHILRNKTKNYTSAFFLDNILNIFFLNNMQKTSRP